MKKICILAYWYPPLQSVGGLRAESFAKYAKDNGFEAIVVSIQPNTLCTPSSPIEKDGENLYRITGFDFNFFLRNLFKKKNPKRSQDNKDQYSSKIQNKFILLLKRLFYFLYRKIFCFPDTHFLWYFLAKRQFEEVIKKEKPDYILTTAFPVSSFYFGRLIKKKYPEIKWIADYRDLWSQHQWYSRPWPLKQFEAWRERNLLKSVDLLITTSKEFQKKLLELHSSRKEVPIIYNGCDEMVNSGKLKTEKFIISYTGVLYDQQNPQILFEAFRELISEKELDANKVQIDFYGKMPDYLPSMVERFKLANYVKIHGLIPREEVINKQRSSNVLLLIRWDEGPLHVKVFEYLAARVPILALVNMKTEIADLINKTNSGSVLSSVLDIKEFIKTEYKHWNDSGSNRLVEYSSYIDDFSRKSQAEKLYSEIKKL